MAQGHFQLRLPSLIDSQECVFEVRSRKPDMEARKHHEDNQYGRHDTCRRSESLVSQTELSENTDAMQVEHDLDQSTTPELQG